MTLDSATQVTDPLGHVRTVTSRSKLVDLATKHRVSRLRTVNDGIGGGTIYNYDTSFRLASVSPIEGRSVSNTYDARGNLSRTQSGANIVTATYAASCDATNFKICNKPLTITGDRLVAAIEAQTVAIGRAIDRCVLTLLAAATAGVVIMVLVAG